MCWVCRSLLQSAARRHAFQSHGLKRMQLQSRGGNFDNLLFDPNLLDDPQGMDGVVMCHVHQVGYF